jgi:hypothetical protein
MVIKVINLKDRKNEDSIAIEKILLQNAVKSYCHGIITKEYLESSLENADYLIIGYDSKKGKHEYKGAIRSYVLVTKKNLKKNNKNYFYIDLICSAPIKKLPDRHGYERNFVAGKNMMDKVEELAKEQKIYTIKLRALGHVMLYYLQLGYTLEIGTPRQKEISKEFNTIVKEKNLKVNDIYIEQFIEWVKNGKDEQPGFKELNKIIKSNTDPSHPPITVNNNVKNQQTQSKINILNDGIKMVKVLRRIRSPRSSRSPRRSRSPRSSRSSSRSPRRSHKRRRRRSIEN